MLHTHFQAIWSMPCLSIVWGFWYSCKMLIRKGCYFGHFFHFSDWMSMAAMGHGHWFRGLEPSSEKCQVTQPSVSVWVYRDPCKHNLSVAQSQANVATTWFIISLCVLAANRSERVADAHLARCVNCHLSDALFVKVLLLVLFLRWKYPVPFSSCSCDL